MHPSPRALDERAPTRRTRWRPLLGVAVLAALVPAIASVAERDASVAAELARAPHAAAAVDAHAFADPVFSADARGDIATIGNVTTTCDPTYANANWSAAESAAACTGAVGGRTGLVRYDGAAMPPINNRLSMQHVDVDDDASTFSSSTASLAIPDGAVILWAGLHWNAATSVPAAEQLYGSDDRTPARAVGDRFRVRFSTPASEGYVALAASPADGAHRDAWDDQNPGGTVSYGGYVDVTDLVAAGGAGTYGVADVQSCTGFGGCFGSWSLTVAFADASMPPRNLNVWHGWQLTSPSIGGGTQQFEVAGITPPPAGRVRARIGVVQADGDRGLGPDSLEISSPSHPSWTAFSTIDRPLAPGEADWFNSTVTTFGARRSDGQATPNLLANLNQDIALVEDDEVIGNDDRAFSFRVRTGGTESLYSQVVHSAVELYAPEVALAKGVDPGGPVPPGGEVTWRVEARNVGLDPVRRAIVTDPLPDGLELVPGSIEFVAGGPPELLGAKTDDLGDDQADWDPSTRTLTFRIGAGASPDEGGTMATADQADDGSDHLVIEYRTRVVSAPGVAVVNPAHVRGEGRALDDPFGPLTTEADASAPIETAPSSDLGITKTDSDAVVRSVGDRYEYAFTVTNAGPSPATGVVISDELDQHLRFVSSPDGCGALDQLVSCSVGDLPVGAEDVRRVLVEVVELPAAQAPIPNLASVDGDQPNPDCVEPTPDAQCNHDDEETPQPAIDLGITKADGDAVLRRVGDRFTYTLEVTNAGPDDATQVAIHDQLDDRLGFAGSERCVADGQDVTCLIGDLSAGEETTATFDVVVRELPDPGRAIPNVASVAGAEPDPDCDDGHPDARCNQDDEETPRPVTTTRTGETPAPSGDGGPSGGGDGGTLVRTGLRVAPLLGLGVALLGGGVALITERRRRRRYEFWER